MMLIIHATSFLLVLVGLLATPIDGFGVQPKGSLSSLLSENSRRRSSLRYQNEESPTASVATASVAKNAELTKPSPTTTDSASVSTTTCSSISSSDDWDLRDDWALQDSVPRYTVGTESATFWTQLRHSTPELAKRSEAELEQRYKEWYSESEDLLLVECGSSPVLLSDWRVSTAAPLPSHATSKQTTPSTTMMSGSLPNGSQIWFPLKCAGTLGDDPMSCNAVDASSSKIAITQDTLDDCFISASMTMHTSSYAESTGGVVYELGAPRCEAHKVYHESRENLDLATGISHSNRYEAPHALTSMERNTGATRATIEAPADLAGHLCKLQQNVVSVAAKNVGTLSAIVAASTMSACLTLGYASSSHMQGAGPLSVTQNQHRQGEMVAAAAKPFSSSSIATSANSPIELTISEKRARAELKVGRDKRSMVLMQERLQKDEVQLKELQKEENRLEAAEWGF